MIFIIDLAICIHIIIFKAKCPNSENYIFDTGSVMIARSFKLRSPVFKSRPGTVSDQVTIIMWGARPG